MVHLAFVDFYNIETVRRIISPWNRILIPPTAYSMFCANVTVWEFLRMVLHVGISKFTNVALNDPYLLRSLFKRDVKHTFKRGLCVQHLVQAQVQKTRTRTTSDKGQIVIASTSFQAGPGPKLHISSDLK